MTIPLKDIWPITNLKDYKIHFARWDGHNEPLEVFVRDKSEWLGWQSYYPGRNDFNRDYIFALARFYHETDAWLFGGVFKVHGLNDDQYDVEVTDDHAPMIGRLKLHIPNPGRVIRANMDTYFDSLSVQEILREPYTGRHFPGYDDIDLSFSELEALVKNERPDWKAALENTKGVYLITDTSTGERYVGSAYGDNGIWSRWTSYVHSGHGGNVELRKLVDDPNLTYCRENFHFALLDHRPPKTPDETIIKRENFWKQVLFTRGEKGLNRN